METPPSNVPPPKESGKQPEIVAKFNQDDPVLKQRVEAFINEAGGPTPAKDKVEIKPNTDFDIPNPNDVMLTEALVNTDKLDISDEEKALFVKALLNDVPCKFKVSLFQGKMVVELRSRTLHEQRRIFDVVNLDQNDGTIKMIKVGDAESPDLAYQITRLQQYCMALMIERINGELFSELVLPKDMSVEDAQSALHKVVAEKIEGLNGIRWSALTNALRIFETKCAKMSTEANSPDFWKPRE